MTKYKFAIGTIVEVEADTQEEANKKVEDIKLDNLEIVQLEPL